MNVLFDYRWELRLMSTNRGISENWALTLGNWWHEDSQDTPVAWLPVSVVDNVLSLRLHLESTSISLQSIYCY